MLPLETWEIYFMTLGSPSNSKTHSFSNSCFGREMFLVFIPEAQSNFRFQKIVFFRVTLTFCSATLTFFPWSISNQLSLLENLSRPNSTLSLNFSPMWRLSWVFSHHFLPVYLLPSIITCSFYLGPGDYPSSLSLNLSFREGVPNIVTAIHMWLFKFQLIKIT